MTALSALLFPTTAVAASVTPSSDASIGAVGASSTAESSGTRAFSESTTSATSLVDSVGVNTHLHYDDTSYGRFEDLVKPRLLELGIRHIRDGAYTYADAGPDSSYYQKLRALGDLGVRLDLTTGMRTNWGGQRTDFTKLDDIQRWTGNAVESFEGVNEPDLQNVPDWVGQTRSVQRDLAQTVRGTPSLAGVQVVAPSVTSEEASSDLGNLAGLVDQANLHNYPSDRHPETTGWGSHDYGSLRWSLAYMAGRVAPQKPVISTETGYFTSPTDNSGLSEKAAGGYTPRLLLNQVAGGVKRTYLYELMRQRTDAGDPEANFGLVRADGSRTPSFLAVRSLIDLLGSTGPSTSPASPGRLGWTVTGSTAGVHQMPIRLASGEYLLAVWTDDVLWDPDRNRDVAPTSRRLDITPAEGLEVTGVVKQDASGEFREQAARGRGARVAVGSRITLLRLGSDTTPGDAVWTDPTLGGATSPVGAERTPPVLHVHGQGRDGRGDVRRGKDARRGTPIAQVADLRKATISSSAGRVRLRVYTTGAQRLSKRDTLSYVVRATGGIPVVRWSSRTGLKKSSKAAPASCAMAAQRPVGRKVFEISVPATCLPQDTRMAITVATALKRSTAGGPHWWVDSMKGPTLSLS